MRFFNSSGYNPRLTKVDQSGTVVLDNDDLNKVFVYTGNGQMTLPSVADLSKDTIITKLTASGYVVGLLPFAGETIGGHPDLYLSQENSSAWLQANAEELKWDIIGLYNNELLESSSSSSLSDESSSSSSSSTFASFTSSSSSSSSSTEAQTSSSSSSSSSLSSSSSSTFASFTSSSSSSSTEASFTSSSSSNSSSSFEFSSFSSSSSSEIPDLPLANLYTYYQPSGMSRHGFDTVSGANLDAVFYMKFGGSSLRTYSSGDHIQQGVNADWDHGTNDWTYETWVRSGSVEANKPMFANMTGGTMNASNIAVAVRVSNQTIYAEVSDGASLTTMTNISTGWNDSNWHHIAYCRDGTTLRFYLDGVELSNSTSYSASLNSGKKITWGSNEDGTSGVIQSFDEMRISDVCRYPNGTTFTTQKFPFNADANTLYLNHCEGTDLSTRIYDSALSTSGCPAWIDDSGNELDVVQATGANQPTGTASSLDGYTGLDFDGSDDSLGASTASDWTFLHDGSDHTIFVVANVTDGSDSSFMSTNNAGSADEGFSFYWGNTNDTGIVYVSKGTVGQPNFNLTMDNDSIPPDTYHSSMIRHENGAGGDDLTTRVDQVAQGSLDPSNLPFNTGSPQIPLCIGCLSGGGLDFDGIMIEIIIYDSALSEATIGEVNDYLNYKYPSLPFNSNSSSSST